MTHLSAIGQHDISRDLYAIEGLRDMPRVLTLIDQNPLSRTYGCGERPYWLYKAVDFSGGMSAEFALPLALAYVHPYPHNQYLGHAKIKELVAAVIRYQAKIAHSDGSADDFYPNDRALGATAFSLYAMSEAAKLAGLTQSDILAFLARRASWLARAHEAGQLSNHHALAALALAATAAATGDHSNRNDVVRLRDRVLGWQTNEGWFPEYGGFDLGYHSFTISFLAKLRALQADDILTEPLGRAVALACDLTGPDGSYGGEVGSRSGYHVLPHGYELLARDFPAARAVADRFLSGLRSGRRAYLDDNRTFCHYQYDFMQAWVDFASRDRCGAWAEDQGVRYYEDAGIVRVRRDGLHAVVSTRKGGVLKASCDSGPVASDTGPAFLADNDRIYAPALDGADRVSVSDASDLVIEVETAFAPTPSRVLPTPLKFIVFRLANVTVGRWFPDLLRRLIQTVLIKPRPRISVTLRRRITLTRASIVVADEIDRGNYPLNMRRLFSTTDLTTTYTASSNPWHESRLFPWDDQYLKVQEFNQAGRITIERTWPISVPRP